MAKLSFVALVAGVAASRSEEGVAYLQTDNVEQTNAREQRLFSMKQRIFAFAEAGVNPAAAEVLRGIAEELREDVLTEIVKEMQTTKGEHDSSIQWFTTIGTTFTTAVGNVGSAESEKSAHTECRAAEGVDYGEERDAHGIFTSAEALVKSLGETADVCDAGWTVTSGDDLTAYLNAGTDAITKRNTLRARESELAAKKADCDAAQVTYEDAACLVASRTQRANSDYHSSYQTAKGIFENAQVGWATLQADRVAQCDTVNKLICYVEALVAHDASGDLTSAISECDGRENDCTSVTFTVDETPTAMADEPMPLTACDEGFDYGALPAGTSAATCKSCVLDADDQGSDVQ